MLMLFSAAAPLNSEFGKDIVSTATTLLQLQSQEDIRNFGLHTNQKEKVIIRCVDGHCSRNVSCGITNFPVIIRLLSDIPQNVWNPNFTL
jgi:hypothetical protein